MDERLPRSGALLLEASRSLLPIMVKEWWVEGGGRDGMVVSRRWGFGVRGCERQGEVRAGKLQSSAVKKQSGSEEDE